MTSNSSINGKAFEYATVLVIQKSLGLEHNQLIDDSSMKIAKARFDNLANSVTKTKMLTDAKTGFNQILLLEPRILDSSTSELKLKLQSDNVAQNGDIRDLLIQNSDEKWEIGLSIKNNSEALKHSRISQNIDFGNKWFGIPCSKEYFSSISPVFSKLESLSLTNQRWDQLADKKREVYLPVLDAFKAELLKLYSKNPEDVIDGISRYLLGSAGNDYYKLIRLNSGVVKVIPFIFRGQINLKSFSTSPSETIPFTDLPTEINSLVYKTNSETTLVMKMNNNWEISFRIHSASTIIEPSLKFDITLNKSSPTLRTFLLP